MAPLQARADILAGCFFFDDQMPMCPGIVAHLGRVWSDRATLVKSCAPIIVLVPAPERPTLVFGMHSSARSLSAILELPVVAQNGRHGPGRLYQFVSIQCHQAGVTGFPDVPDRLRQSARSDVFWMGDPVARHAETGWTVADAAAH